MRRAACFLVVLLCFLISGVAVAQDVRPPDDAVQAAQPGGIAEQRYDNHADYWRQVRQGEDGYVPSPDAKSGVMITSAGEGWRNLRNGPYLRWSGYLLLGMIGLLSLFYALRGRMRVESGMSGFEIRRFKFVERFTHWLTASSFVVLALSGITLIFGRSLLIPLVGKEAFAAWSIFAKTLHNYVSFAFMLGIVLMAILWVAQNMPTRNDWRWFTAAGGFFGGHAPAAKFNAGQKILFWLVILFGVSISLSGLQLLFPGQIVLFGKTFAVLNWLPFVDLPTQLTAVHEMQLATLWHGIVAVVYTALILGHIYIGSIGMEGAFSAMGSGRVDLNWAREHHDVWVERLQEPGTPRR